MDVTETSLGLSPRLAAALGYSGWWITGLLFWLLERRDPFVRFHAAQAVTAFGAMAVLIGTLAALALLSLTFVPAAFDTLVIAAQAAVALAVILWIISMWRVASGHDWRIPIADRWAKKML